MPSISVVLWPADMRVESVGLLIATHCVRQHQQIVQQVILSSERYR